MNDVIQVTPKSHKPSWILSIFVNELNTSHNLRVSDSTIVSSIAQDLVNKIYMKYDWSEFWFWCPSMEIWLLPKSSSLSQFNIHSDTKIHFLRRFHVLNIQLPDLQIRQLLLDFSKTVYQTNQIICKKFGIRHHEELSLQLKLIEKSGNGTSTPVPNRGRKSLSVSQQILSPSKITVRPATPLSDSISKRRMKTFFNSSDNSQSNMSMKTQSPSPACLMSPKSFFSIFESSICSQNENDSLYFESFENSKLSNSPVKSYSEAVKNKDIVIIKTYKDRSNLRNRWMISESTLMKQASGDFNNIVLLLRYKYHNYYYLNEKYDEIRINQIFHQAFWSVLSGETDCMADEAYLLAGIFHQVNKSSMNQSNLENIEPYKNSLDKEIDIMLDKIHLELIGRCEDQDENDLIEISGSIQYIECPKNVFSRYKKCHATLGLDGIRLYNNRSANAFGKIPVKGNEILLNVKLTDKEVFFLEIVLLKKNLNNCNHTAKNNQLIEKYKMKFTNKQEFVKWATGLRLLTKSINFSQMTNYQYEYQVVMNIVEMKRPQLNWKLISLSNDDKNMILSDFIPTRFNKGFRRTEIIQKIVFFSKAFNHTSTLHAKIAYIKCWLTLTNAGLSYYQVRINSEKAVILIGLGYDRVILVDIDLGIVMQSFELSKLENFKTNWELIFTAMEFPNETLTVKFSNVVDCQIFHEHLGGYLFIMMRNSEKFGDLSEKMFRTLTARHTNTL